MFYHPSKTAALDAGSPYEDRFHVRAELEPHNGWVLVLSPKSRDAFTEPLVALLGVAEIDLSGWPRLRKAPATRRPTPPIPSAKDVTDEPSATWKEGDPRPW